MRFTLDSTTSSPGSSCSSTPRLGTTCDFVELPHDQSFEDAFSTPRGDNSALFRFAVVNELKQNLNSDFSQSSYSRQIKVSVKSELSFVDSSLERNPSQESVSSPSNASKYSETDSLADSTLLKRIQLASDSLLSLQQMEGRQSLRRISVRAHTFDWIQCQERKLIYKWLLEHATHYLQLDARVCQLTLIYLDRFNMIHEIYEQEKLQLLAIVAYRLAIKNYFTDDKLPSVHEMNQYGGTSYSQDQANELELKLLETLNWEAHDVSERCFLESYFYLIEHQGIRRIKNPTKWLQFKEKAMYFADLIYKYPSMLLPYSPSIIGASAILLARLFTLLEIYSETDPSRDVDQLWKGNLNESIALFGEDLVWPDTWIEITSYPMVQIQQSVEKIHSIWSEHENINSTSQWWTSF